MIYNLHPKFSSLCREALCKGSFESALSGGRATICWRLMIIRWGRSGMSRI
jgi:hypothetical protein